MCEWELLESELRYLCLQMFPVSFYCIEASGTELCCIQANKKPRCFLVAVIYVAVRTLWV